MSNVYLVAIMTHLTICIAVSFTPKVGTARVWFHRAALAAALVCLTAVWSIDPEYRLYLAPATIGLVAANIWAERLATGNRRRARAQVPS